MTTSTHKCEVVIVHPKPHPNADRLEVVEVYGYSVCVGKGEFQDGSLGVYIPPDSVVPATERFKFVWEMRGYAEPPYSTEHNEFIVPEKYRRIKAKMLRGIVSEGLLIPVRVSDLVGWGIIVTGPGPDDYVDVEAGDDAATILDITHYNPPDVSIAGDCERAPGKGAKKRGYPKTLKGWVRFIWYKLFPGPKQHGHEETTSLTIPDYEIDSWQRYKNLLWPGEQVWITEKIHGANCKFTYQWDFAFEDKPEGGRMYAGSHYQWKKDVPGSIFWMAMRQNPWIEAFCKAHPGFVLYGELIPTQKLHYGLTKGEYKVLGFDVLDPSLKSPDGPQGKWFNYAELEELGLLHSVNWVPTVMITEYNETNIRQYAEGPSLVANAIHIREGVVIRPIKERHSYGFGRVILKLVSPTYLAGKQSDE